MQVGATVCRQEVEQLESGDVLVGKSREHIGDSREERAVAHIFTKSMDHQRTFVVGSSAVGNLLRHGVERPIALVIDMGIAQHLGVQGADILLVAVDKRVGGRIELLVGQRLAVAGKSLVEPHLLGTQTGHEVAEPHVRELVDVQ